MLQEWHGNLVGHARAVRKCSIATEAISAMMVCHMILRRDEAFGIAFGEFQEIIGKANACRSLVATSSTIQI